MTAETKEIKFEKEMFDKDLPVLAFEVENKNLNKVLKSGDLKPYLLTLKNFRPVQEGTKETKKVLLSSQYQAEDLHEFSEDTKKFILDNSVPNSIKKTTIRTNYENYSFHEVMRVILPQELEVPTAFDQVGHIAHFNLRDELLPYRFVIGKILLDKTPTVLTVVNKLGMIDSLFREFKMELLAGKDDFFVTVREHGVQLQFDFREVYWNSRLQTEHQRILTFFKDCSPEEDEFPENSSKNSKKLIKKAQILQMFKKTEKSDIICDMFAGVGPFAIPAAVKRGCIVYANDLNPASYKYLVKNTQLNNVADLVYSYNLDGREFVRKLMEEIIEGKSKREMFNHAIMNLPGSATEFLDVFCGLFNENNYSKVLEIMKNAQNKTKIEEIEMPIIHCYTFIKLEEIKKQEKKQQTITTNKQYDKTIYCAEAKEKVIEQLRLSSGFSDDFELNIDFVDVFCVRDVSVLKQMVCVSFKLPLCVATAPNPTGINAQMQQQQQQKNGKKRSFSSIYEEEEEQKPEDDEIPKNKQNLEEELPKKVQKFE